MPQQHSTQQLAKLQPILSFECRSCSKVYSGNTSEDAHCDCQNTVSFSQGVFAFNNPSTVSAYRLNDEKFKQFYTMSKSYGWARAFYSLLRDEESDAAAHYSSVFNLALSGWKWLLPFNNQSRFICIGAAKEAIALGLSTHGAEVVVVDRCRDRLLALSEAACSQGASVTCLESDSLLNLPFREQSFDALVIHDLQDTLRFFGSANARSLSKEQLANLKQLLKPSGSLFVAGDNRFTYTGTSLNEEERFSSNTRRPRKSSTSGNSFRGYQQKIREAGFWPAEVFAPLPSHRNAREYIPIGGVGRVAKNSQKDLPTKVKEGIALHPRFLKTFGHSFSIIASNSEQGGYSFFEELLLRLEWQLKLSSIEVERISFNAQETSVYAVSKGIPLLIRIPQSPSAAIETRQNALRLKFLATEKIPKFLKNLAPVWLHSSEQDGVVVSLETRTRGTLLRDNIKYLESGLFNEEITRFFHTCSAIRGGSRSAVFPILSEMLDSSERRIIDRSIRQEFLVKGQNIVKESRTLGLPGVLVHGSLGLDNIFVSQESRELNGVVDWQWSLERGLPGWDFISLACSYIQARYGCSFGEAILWLLEQGNPAVFDSVWKRYCESLRIQERQRPTLILSYWLVRLWQNLSTTSTPLNYPWLRRNLISVLEHCE